MRSPHSCSQEGVIILRHQVRQDARCLCPLGWTREWPEKKHQSEHSVAVFYGVQWKKSYSYLKNKKIHISSMKKTNPMKGLYPFTYISPRFSLAQVWNETYEGCWPGIPWLVSSHDCTLRLALTHPVQFYIQTSRPTFGLNKQALAVYPGRRPTSRRWRMQRSWPSIIRHQQFVLLAVMP